MQLLAFAVLAAFTVTAGAGAQSSAAFLAPASPASIRIISADYGKAAGALNRMFRFCIGAGRANEGLRADWRDLGSPSQLTRAQVQAWRSASSGAPAIDEMIQVGADGRFSRRFAMRENDAWLVELRPL